MSSVPFGHDAQVGPDELVFHYTTLERAAAIALTGKLLLSPLSILNDPQESECRPPTISTAYLFEPDGGNDPKPLADAALARRQGIRVVCFTLDADTPSSPSSPGSATRGFAHPSMWAHYGGKHEGVCIAFDRSGLERWARESGHVVHHRAVQYVQGANGFVARSETIDIDEPDPMGQHRALIASLFTKSDDWAPEREHRIVIEDWRHGEPCAIPVTGLVRGLALGHRLPAHQLPLVESLTETFGLAEHQVALMSSGAGLLPAVPLWGPDGRPHRWSAAELHHWLDLFDPPQPDIPNPEIDD